jgi:hypothetical protein
MAKSTFEYNLIALKDFDPTAPITQIVEADAYYQFLIDLSKLKKPVKLHTSSEYDEGGIRVREYVNIVEWAREEQADCILAFHNIAEDATQELSTAQILEWLTQADSMDRNDLMFASKIGVVQAVKLPRPLQDADKLYSFIEDDEEQEGEEDC